MMNEELSIILDLKALRSQTLSWKTLREPLSVRTVIIDNVATLHASGISSVLDVWSLTPATTTNHYYSLALTRWGILESILRTNCYGPLKSNYEVKPMKSMKPKPKNII